MNRSETQLLVENWRALLKKSEEDFILEESLMKSLGMAAIGMIGSILGGMADVEVASAMPPHEIASELDDAFAEKSPGNFEIVEDENGNIIGKYLKTGQKQLILTPEQCDNISSSELQKAINTLHDKGYSKYKEELMKAAEKTEAEVIADKSSEKRSFVERINSIDDKVLDEIIDDFSGPDNDGTFNLEAMQYAVSAGRLYRNDPVFKKYKSEKVVNVYLIMKHHNQGY